MPQNLWSRKYSSLFKKLFFTSVVAILVFFVISLLDFGFKINEIRVEGKTSDYSIVGLNSYKNLNLILVKTQDMEDKIKKENSGIKNVVITKSYPHTLIIKIEEYTPLAVLDNFGTFFYLGEDGRIISKSKSENIHLTLPTIHYYQSFNYYSYNAGDWITNIDLSTSLHFIKSVENLGLKVSKVDIGGLNMIVLNVDDKQIIFTTQKPKETQDYEIEQIIKQFKIEGRDFKNIDLRFDKPIVKF